MKNGFTLIEMSIVISIVALLAIGVVGGDVLIKQAQTRRVIAAIEEGRIAYTSFESEYGRMPGDMPDASVFWSTTCGETADACNGNGNDQLDFTYAGGTDEALPIIKHLELAGFLKSSTPLLTETYIEPLQYLPTIGADMGYSFTPTGFTDVIGSGLTMQMLMVDSPRSIMMVIGKQRTGTAFGFNGFYFNGAFTPLEAYNVDHKIDDGTYDGTNYIGSGTGKIWVNFAMDRTENGIFDDCNILGGPWPESPGNRYVIDVKSKTCAMMYMIRR